MATDVIARGMAGSTKKALDEYKNNPDVSDIVATKSDLNNYDTSKLNVNDIVKVLVDESQNNKETYYKWTGTTFQYVGGLGPYYTTSEIDNKINESHCYVFNNSDFDGTTVSDRFKDAIRNGAMFVYIGDHFPDIFPSSDGYLGYSVFIPEDKFYNIGSAIYSVIRHDYDTGRQYRAYINFALNGNTLSVGLNRVDYEYIPSDTPNPVITFDTDGYTYDSTSQVLYLPDALQAMSDSGIGKEQVCILHLSDNNNLLDTLPNDTKIMLGSSDVSFPTLDINSGVNISAGQLTAPSLTIGSIKRFRISETDPVLKNSCMVPLYLMQLTDFGIQVAGVVITERSNNNGSGGSGSGETLKIIKLGAVWVDDVYIGLLSSEFDKMLEETSQQMGITITEDMIPTIWANGSDYEKLTVLYALAVHRLFACVGSYNALSFIPTFTEVNGTTIVTSLEFSYVDSSNQIDTSPTYSDLSSSTISITTIGGGNGGSSASSGAYYEIKTSDIAFYDENGTQLANYGLDNLRITMSEGQFEALKEKVNPMLTQMGLTALTDINSLITMLNSVFTETQADANNMAIPMFYFINGYCDFVSDINISGTSFPVKLSLTMYNELFVFYTGIEADDSITGMGVNLANNNIPYGISATWTLTEYGTSGGSSTSESYYKIQIQDSGTSSPVVLQMLIPHDSMSEILANISDIMQQTITTPTDLINLFDTLKGNANYYNHLLILMVYFAIINQQFNLNNLFEENNDGATGKISAVWLLGGIFVNGTDIFSTELGPSTISFTSNASLTITETTTQEIEPTIDYIDLWTHILGGN